MGTSVKEDDGEDEDKKGTITVGVLALQGAFNEHIQLLKRAAQIFTTSSSSSSKNSLLPGQSWKFLEVRTASELNQCDALIIPGGESTAISLVAQRSNLLEPLREFVKVDRKPTWGTCAGLILLAESANRTKKGGQELIGGLDVRVNRNHYGRQIESFEAALDLPFLCEVPSASAATIKQGSLDAGPDEMRNHLDAGTTASRPFNAIFIRAPIVEKLLPPHPPHVSDGVQGPEAHDVLEDETVVAAPAPSLPSPGVLAQRASVEVLGRLPGRRRRVVAVSTDEASAPPAIATAADPGDIVAVRQGNVFGTSFHPELTGDPRIHVWWLEQVALAVDSSHSSA